MQLASNLVALIALSASPLSGASAAAIHKRGTTVASVVFSLTRDTCDAAAGATTIGVPLAGACGKCTLIPAGSSKNRQFQALHVTQLDRRCRVRVYKDALCTSDGQESGTGPCWSPEGGFNAYKVDCPWWPVAEGGPMC